MAKAIASSISRQALLNYIRKPAKSTQQPVSSWKAAVSIALPGLSWLWVLWPQMIMHYGTASSLPSSSCLAIPLWEQPAIWNNPFPPLSCFLVGVFLSKQQSENQLSAELESKLVFLSGRLVPEWLHRFTYAVLISPSLLQELLLPVVLLSWTGWIC